MPLTAEFRFNRWNRVGRRGGVVGRSAARAPQLHLEVHSGLDLLNYCCNPFNHTRREDIRNVVFHQRVGNVISNVVATPELIKFQ